MTATYFRDKKTLTFDDEVMQFDTQEQARKWLDDNGHFRVGLNLWL